MTLDTAGTADVVTSVSKITAALSLTHVLYAILILLICVVVSKVLLTVIARSLTKFKIDRSLHTFILSTSRIFMGFITVLLVGDYVGIPMSSLIAVLGVAGLAVSLSIQGTLSNLAGGIMILVSKPFSVGDYIQAGDVDGVVADIGLVYTQLKTLDNKMIFVPNGHVADAKITNFTHQTLRRVDLQFDIAYESNPEVAKACIMGVVENHPLAVTDPAPFIRVMSYGESSVGVVSRVWCATGDYWTVYADMMEQVRAAFEAKGVELTYNHLNVHLVEK